MGLKTVFFGFACDRHVAPLELERSTGTALPLKNWTQIFGFERTKL
jgi:hypothetical protein